MPDLCFGVETGKHDRADLHATDSAFSIEFDGQRLGGKFILRDVWQDRARIDVYAVSARGLDGGDACLVELTGQVGSLPETIREIRFVESLVQADRHCVEVAACQPTIGGETFAQD